MIKERRSEGAKSKDFKLNFSLQGKSKARIQIF